VQLTTEREAALARMDGGELDALLDHLKREHR
jgi:hypothetical protein